MNDRLFKAAGIPLLAFMLMMALAIMGEYNGELSQAQISKLMSWAFAPLFLSTLLMIPACFIPEHRTPVA